MFGTAKVRKIIDIPTYARKFLSTHSRPAPASLPHGIFKFVVLPDHLYRIESSAQFPFGNTRFAVVERTTGGNVLKIWEVSFASALIVFIISLLSGLVRLFFAFCSVS